jgi:predicted dehydrogenase
MNPTSPINRRCFIAQASLVTTSFLLGSCATPPRRRPRRVSPNSKMRVASIGVGGIGGWTTAQLAAFADIEIAALCDVDPVYAEKNVIKYPGVPFYKDYREMFEKESSLDAVMIATPDHWHAPIALAAMLRGLHVYCEKPLAHTIEEARLMGRIARETGVVTQMGNTGHAGEGLRLTKEWIDAGVIGAVSEVHVWSDRPGRSWPTQGRRRPTENMPVPPGLDWSLWLGPAAVRPYHRDYCPGWWRGWLDFGCGALGDMAVHNADSAFYALDLGAPDWVDAQTSPTNPDSFPEWSIVTYGFPGNARRGPVKLVWYDGGKLPPRPSHLETERSLGDNGVYFVGSTGVLMAPGWSGTPRLVPETKMQEFRRPDKTIARSPGHYREWIDACRAGRPELARAGFPNSAPYTENLLVGLLPVVAGKRITWDAANMAAVNAPEIAPFISKQYRAGFDLPAGLRRKPARASRLLG